MRIIREIIEKRRLILNLGNNDFKNKFKGSYFGIVWAFANPLITILLYWFVFQIGFRSGATTNGTPFVLWLICGMIPWFYFAEGFSSATNCFLEYNYLVKKVVFKISILPLVKIISSLYVHFFFLGFLVVFLLMYNVFPSIAWIQVFYYLFCIICLLLGVSFITSAIVPFFKDMSQIVSIILQIGFWLTPIVWSMEIVPMKFQLLFKLNPFYYIAEGYRDSFLNNVWFWDKPYETLYFWAVVIVVNVIGLIMFKKLKPHFSDVL